MTSSRRIAIPKRIGVMVSLCTLTTFIAFPQAPMADQAIGIAVASSGKLKSRPGTKTKLPVKVQASGPNPYLSFLPAEQERDYEGWEKKLREQAVQKRVSKERFQQESGAAFANLSIPESEPSGTLGQNDTIATAQFIPGLGTESGEDPAGDVTGEMRPLPSPSVIGPFAEDDGNINQANSANVISGDGVTLAGTIGDGDFGSVPSTDRAVGPFAEDDGNLNVANITNVVAGERVFTDGITSVIGDGDYGSAGSMTGDLDIYEFVVDIPGPTNQQTIILRVDNPPGDSSLDPILGLYDSSGTLIGWNDDGGGNFQSAFILTVSCDPAPPCSATYFMAAGGYIALPTEDSFLSDPFDSSTGPGIGSEGPYVASIEFTEVRSGDFDFFQVNLVAGDSLIIDVDTPDPFGDLDPIIGVYLADGTLVAFNDDGDTSSWDSFLNFQTFVTGLHYVAVGGFNPDIFPTSPASLPADPFDSSSGPGTGSEGTYDLKLFRNAVDVDYYSFDLDVGDIVGASVLTCNPCATGEAPAIGLFAPDGNLLLSTANDITGIYPLSSPLPGGGNAALGYVVDKAGTYAVAVGFGFGSYSLDLRLYRPPQEISEEQQVLFLDFDGQDIDTSIFGSSLSPGDQPATLSPLSSFLANWGLQPSDEDAVIDSIIAAVTESLYKDARLGGANPTFDVEILNSRDHADPFPGPNVSRIIIGGTIAESGVSTIGIAQSIDVGNWDQAETALVLLDLLSAPAPDSDSLNSYPIDPGSSIIDLIGIGVGNIVAHEAGHFFANFHTNNFNLVLNIMDTGGNLANLIGLGDDFTFGTSDDVDVDFGLDEYDPFEGFTGVENTLESIAFGLSTGRSKSSVLIRRSDNGRWYNYGLDGQLIVSGDNADLTSNLSWEVVATDDFNGDRRTDVLIRRPDDGRWYLYLMDGATILDSASMDFPRSTDWQIAAVADFNGDGSADLLLQNQANGRWRMYLLDGLMVAETSLVSLPGGLVWSSFASGNFDLDGFGDVLLQRSDNGRWRMYRFNGTMIEETALVGLPENAVWQFQRAVDVSGDGRLDVLYRRSDNGRWRLYMMDGTNIQSEGLVDLPTGPQWQLETMADFNFDGRSDVLLRNTATETWYVYLLDGTNIDDQAVLSIPGDLVLQLQAVGDFDFDRKPDLLIRNTNNGRWFVYTIDGTNVTTSGNVNMTNNLVWSVILQETN